MLGNLWKKGWVFWFIRTLLNFSRPLLASWWLGPSDHWLFYSLFLSLVSICQVNNKIIPKGLIVTCFLPILTHCFHLSPDLSLYFFFLSSDSSASLIFYNFFFSTFRFKYMRKIFSKVTNLSKHFSMCNRNPTPWEPTCGFINKNSYTINWNCICCIKVFSKFK